MPGEANIPQSEILVFDRNSKQRVTVKEDRFPDQGVQIAAAPQRNNIQRDPTPPRPGSSGSATPPTSCTSRASAATCTASTSPSPTRRPARSRPLIEERLEHLHRVEAAAPGQQRRGARLLVRARRLGALLSVRRGNRRAEEPDHRRRVRRHRHRGRRRQGARRVSLGRRPREGRGPVLHAPLPRRLRRHRASSCSTPATRRTACRSPNRAATSSTTRRASTRAPESILYDATRCNVVMKLETPDLTRADGGRLQVPGAVHGEGRRWHHGPLRRDVQAVRLRSDEEVSDHRVRLSRPADRERDQDVLPAQQQHLARAVRLHRHRGRQPRRQPDSGRSGTTTTATATCATTAWPTRRRRSSSSRKRHSFIDINRVGIWGHSGGGFMSAAAMLVYPDFFKVALSESGNHENNIYNNTLEREAPRRQGSREGRQGHLRVRHREELGAGEEPEGPPDARSPATSTTTSIRPTPIGWPTR